MDISPFTKDIISFSKNKIILHRIKETPENPNFFKDQQLLTSALRWEAVWDLDLFLPINSLRFSTIGDFFVATGNEVFNLWRKDADTPFFSSEVFFSVDKEIAIPSKKTEFLSTNQLGKIAQCEISIEGRLIITLEENHNKLKIWYNDYKKQEPQENGCGTPDSKSPVSPFQVWVDNNILASRRWQREPISQTTDQE